MFLKNILIGHQQIHSTVFWDKLKKAYSNKIVVNPILISDDIAKTLGVNVDDTITISVNDTKIEYFIKGIFESDGRNVGGTMIVVVRKK